MATIKASGKTEMFGMQKITINGDKLVSSVACNDKEFRLLVVDWIKNKKGKMANAYSPPENTMLQAYATLQTIFGYKNVEAVGDIGEMPYEKGVIY